jgi:hypothetical protein
MVTEAARQNASEKGNRTNIMKNIIGLSLTLAVAGLSFAQTTPAPAAAPAKTDAAAPMATKHVKKHKKAVAATPAATPSATPAPTK